MSISARDEILARLATAPAAGHQTGRSSPVDVVEQVRKNCDANRADLIERFRLELSRVGGRLHVAGSASAVIDCVKELAFEHGPEASAVGWRDPVIDELGLPDALEAAGVRFLADDEECESGEFAAGASRAAIGISGVDYALADTGTLVVASGSGRARSASLLPPVHVAILKPEQIVSGLDDLFVLLERERSDSGCGPASAITFITGPSRTGDIEMTLVIGVHGPQQLHVILLTSEIE